MPDHKELVSNLVKDLSAPSRRKRQEAAHFIAIAADGEPDLVMPFIDELIDALFRPEAQTRWEVLDALSALAKIDATAVEAGFDGAEASLFDDGSATVRLSAFVFLCRLAASSPERSDTAWPLIDEAIQCFHGDAEYHDMLVALLDMAQGEASEATKKALADRVKFDSENGSGYIKSYSIEILSALK